MINVKLTGKKVLSCLVALALILLLTISNANAATENIIDSAIDAIFLMDNSDDFIDAIVLCDALDDPASFAQAYSDGFSQLSSSDQATLTEYGLTSSFISAFANVLDNDSSNNLDAAELKAFISAGDKSGFKNAICSTKEQDIIDVLNAHGLTSTTIQNSINKFDSIYGAINQISSSSIVNYKFIETTKSYGALTLNEEIADSMISLAEGLNIIEAHDNTSLINALGSIVDFYNQSNSSNKTLIYDYLDNYGFINVVTSDGDDSSSSSETETEPVNDVQVVIDVPEPVVTDGVAIAEVSSSVLASAADTAVTEALKAAEELASSGEEQTRNINVVVVLEIPETGENSIEVALPAGSIDDVFNAGVDSVDIKTELATFSITKETFGDTAVGKDIVLGANTVSESEIPTGANIPEGSLVVDLNAAVNGEKVSEFSKAIKVGIPYNGTATNGESVTVFLLKDDGTIEAVGGKYNAQTGQVTFLTKHFSKYFAKKNIKEFNDIANYVWAKDAIEIMGGKGIINGVGDNYCPAKNITRAEFCALIARMFQLNGSTTKVFTDVKVDAWYYDEVMAAYASGIVTGNSETTFNPNGLITRQEMSVIIARILASYGYLPAQSEQLSGYADAPDVAAWAENGVSLVVREAIINGIDNTHIAPSNNATRAESAVILYRLFNKVM